MVVPGLTVPAHSRGTFKVNDLLGADYQASLELESDQPVVAERSMYFAYATAVAAPGRGPLREVGRPPPPTPATSRRAPPAPVSRNG